MAWTHWCEKKSRAATVREAFWCQMLLSHRILPQQYTKIWNTFPSEIVWTLQKVLIFLAGEEKFPCMGDNCDRKDISYTWVPSPRVPEHPCQGCCSQVDRSALCQRLLRLTLNKYRACFKQPDWKQQMRTRWCTFAVAAPALEMAALDSGAGRRARHKNPSPPP